MVRYVAGPARQPWKRSEFWKRKLNKGLHFDVDVIDGAELPATDIPHSGGLSFRDATEALQVLFSRPSAVGLVVTEFKPVS